MPKYRSKGGIYIIQFDTGIKIGVSKNFKQRFTEQYLKPWCKPIIKYQMIHSYKAKYIEKAIKTYYKNFTVKGSNEFFFGITFDDVISSFHILNRLTIEELIDYNKSKKKLDDL